MKRSCFVPKGHDENNPAFQGREFGQVNLSPGGTTDRCCQGTKRMPLTDFQPSLWDLLVILIEPSVETPGYCRLSLWDRCVRLSFGLFGEFIQNISALK
jgi:hypothetical protein